MASDSSSATIMSSSPPSPMPSDTVVDVDTSLSSPNTSSSPMTSDSSSDSDMSSSPPNPTPSKSVLDVENNLSSPPMTSNANHYPTPSNSISYDHQTYCLAPPSQVYEAFRPSYYPPPPPYFDRPPYDPNEGRKKYCLCRLILIIIMLTIYIEIITYFVDLHYKPKLPTVNLTSVNVSSFATYSKSSTISSDFTLTFSIENPNQHMDITYGGPHSHVLYRHETIASQNHHRIVHNAGKTISQEVRLVEVDPDASINTINQIDDDVANNHGLVKFGVKMEALLAFSKIHWIPKLLAVNCPDVNIQFENGTTKGTMMGPAIRCHAVASGA